MTIALSLMGGCDRDDGLPQAGPPTAAGPPGQPPEFPVLDAVVRGAHFHFESSAAWHPSLESEPVDVAFHNLPHGDRSLFVLLWEPNPHLGILSVGAWHVEPTALVIDFVSQNPPWLPEEPVTLRFTALFNHDGALTIINQDTGSASTSTGPRRSIPANLTPGPPSGTGLPGP